MLRIVTEKQELYDELTNQFVYLDPFEYWFEHSLVAISQWESKYKKAFLSADTKTSDELIDYVQFMCLTPDFDVNKLSHSDLSKVVEYIAEQPSATKVTTKSANTNGQIMTSEVIYAYMAMSSIPFECDKWNLHRVLNLLQVYGALNQPKEKMGRRETLEQNKALNAARRAKLKTKG